MHYDLTASEGLFVSDDGAQTFMQVPQNVSRIGINCITTRPGDVLGCYVGFNGSGLFRVNDFLSFEQ